MWFCLKFASLISQLIFEWITCSWKLLHVWAYFQNEATRPYQNQPALPTETKLELLYPLGFLKAVLKHLVPYFVLLTHKHQNPSMFLVHSFWFLVVCVQSLLGCLGWNTYVCACCGYQTMAPKEPSGLISCASQKLPIIIIIQIYTAMRGSG